MRKRVGAFSFVVLVGLVSVSMGAIQSISVNYIDSSYTAAGGTLTLSDAADVVVEDTLGNQTTYANGSFTMATTLASDLSAGGLAYGSFTGGSLDFWDSGANSLLSGNVQTLNLTEVFNNVGILAGEGQFVVTGGSLAGDFALPFGDIVQITFQVSPPTLSDFSADFEGISNLTITPVPEPATIGLFTIGSLFLIRKKK